MSVVLLVRLGLIGIGLALGFQAAVVWGRRRLAPGAAGFSLLLLSASVYALGYAGEVGEKTLAQALFWLHVEYLAIPWIPAFWLLAVRHHQRLRTRQALLFFVVPGITFVSALAGLQHGLVNRAIEFVPQGPFWVVVARPGLIGLLYIVYLYAALLWGASRYAATLRSGSSLFRKQALVILSGSLVPLLGHLLYFSGLSPYRLDLSPLALAVTIAVIQRGFHYRCFEVAPVARDYVFNNMRDAVLVLDVQGRLVDFNFAAQHLLPMLGDECVGQDTGALLADIPQLREALTGPAPLRAIPLQTGDETRYFDVRTFPLRAARNEDAIGRAAILADTTAQVRLVHKLRQHAETDPLTGIANRRRFLEVLSQEHRRAVRYSLPLSMLMVDLDDFKLVNDRFGHPTGDSVLCAAVVRMAACLRTSDLLARLGGEEFAILLPVTGRAGAMEAAERIRNTLRDSTIDVNGHSIPITASVGVASLDKAEGDQPEQLIEQADHALYLAKAAGRDRIEC